MTTAAFTYILSFLRPRIAYGERTKNVNVIVNVDVLVNVHGLVNVDGFEKLI